MKLVDFIGKGVKIHIFWNMDNNILNTISFHSRPPFDKYQTLYVMKMSVCPIPSYEAV